MASHHQPAIRARSLANVLADLKEARADWDAASAAVSRDLLFNDDEDAPDRLSEAETRLEDLRDECAARFVEATGLTIEDFRNAYSEALI